MIRKFFKKWRLKSRAQTFRRYKTSKPFNKWGNRWMVRRNSRQHSTQYRRTYRRPARHHPYSRRIRRRRMVGRKPPSPRRRR